MVTVIGRNFHSKIGVEDLESSRPMMLHRLWQRKGWLPLMQLAKRETSGFKRSRPRSCALRLLQYVWYVSVATDSTVYECHTNLTFNIARNYGDQLRRCMLAAGAGMSLAGIAMLAYASATRCVSNAASSLAISSSAA